MPGFTYGDAVAGGRAALRHAREQQQEAEGWKRLAIELPYLPPRGSRGGDDDVDGEIVRPFDYGDWPGGLSQMHREGLRPLVDELFVGWEAEFSGLIDVGMGVWKLAGGKATAISHVGDSSVSKFLDLCDGEFGDGPTRDDHTLILLNPTFSAASAVGQPWSRKLRREAAARLETAEWQWIYRAIPRPDDSAPRTVWSLSSARVEYEGSGACDVSTVVDRQSSSVS